MGVLTQPHGFWEVSQSTWDHDSSSSTRPSPSNGQIVTAVVDEVRITRLTVPALTHDLITFRVPRTAGSIRSFCPRINQALEERNICELCSVQESSPEQEI